MLAVSFMNGLLSRGIAIFIASRTQLRLGLLIDADEIAKFEQPNCTLPFNFAHLVLLNRLQ